MKKLTVAAVTLMAVVSGTAMAEGSKIEKSTLINASKNTLTNTQAIGKNSAASTGSISVVGSKVEKSTLINASKNTLTNTQAIGKNTVATTGSIDVR
jgi:peroxiredoxin